MVRETRKGNIISDHHSELCAFDAVVSGRVQGVMFRDGVRCIALNLGIAGEARNLDDGTVFVHAEGTHKALDTLRAYLEHGPPLAQVETVSYERVRPNRSHHTFSIL